MYPHFHPTKFRKKLDSFHISYVHNVQLAPLAVLHYDVVLGVISYTEASCSDREVPIVLSVYK